MVYESRLCILTLVLCTAWAHPLPSDDLAGDRNIQPTQESQEHRQSLQQENANQQTINLDAISEQDTLLKTKQLSRKSQNDRNSVLDNTEEKATFSLNDICRDTSAGNHVTKQLCKQHVISQQSMDALCIHLCK